jgi:glycosyltransferase involved in cell wall biosynthesis
MTPSVTAIVQVFNGERFVADAIRSIQQQTVPPQEIIVVNDGSSDATDRVVRGFGDQVRYLGQDNQGPAAARNAGIAMATGELICFLDADDLWHPEKQQRELARLAERPELDIVFCGMRNVAFDEHSGFDPGRWPIIPISPCTMLARRAVFERIGVFDPKLRRGEDTEWYVRMMMRQVKYEVLPEILLERRIHGQNLTTDHASSPMDVVPLLKQVLDQRRREGW